MARHRWAFLCGWVLAVAALAFFAASTPRLLSPAGFETDTEASHVEDFLRREFPERASPVVFVAFQSSRDPVMAPAYQAELAAWKTDLERVTRGHRVAIIGPSPGRDGRSALLEVRSSENPTRFVEAGRQLEAVHHDGPARSYVGGFGAVYNDFIAYSENDLASAERVSLPIALLLLLLVFGGLVAGLLPVLTGLAAVTVALALLGFVARVHTVSIFSLNVTTIMGIGLGIDYSLLVVNRFREELRAGAELEEAVATTVATAGVATMISGGTVAIGFGALMLSHLNVLWSIGLGGALVVAVSVVASLTLIPALLAIFVRHIDRMALPFTRDRDTGPFWRGLAGRVLARPVLFIAVSLAVVALLLWPARSLRLGVVGTESLPSGTPARVAQRLGEEQLGFPPHAPTLIVAHGVPDMRAAAEVERRLRVAARGQPVRGVAEVPPEMASLYLRGGYAVYELEQPAADNDQRTRDWLDHLRSTPLPPGVTMQIGGEAAAYLDFLRVLLSDLPLVFGTVLGCTLVLLGLFFRSAVLPVKAVLMNLLSVGGAMGALVWGFQDGHFSRLLDFEAMGFIEATIPPVIFAGLFGLSMDYEVFLLSRIREHWLQGHDNARAVALGMERTGQIITSAALILVAMSARWPSATWPSTRGWVCASRSPSSSTLP